MTTRNTLRGAPRWVHGFAWGVTGAFTLVLVVLYLICRDADVWMILCDTPLPAKHGFNEALHASIYRQPANTLSNLTYVLVGLYVIAYAWWDYRRPTKQTDPCAVRHPALVGLFGVTCIEVGIGSGLMHAAMTSWGHKLDVLGMIATLSALLALHCARWVPSIPIGGRRWPTWPVAGLRLTRARLLCLESRQGSAVQFPRFLVPRACRLAPAHYRQLGQHRHFLSLRSAYCVPYLVTWKLNIPRASHETTALKRWRLQDGHKSRRNGYRESKEKMK